MWSKKSVDELSLEELERLVLLKRREERQRRLRRRVPSVPDVPPPPPPDVRRHDDLAFMGRAHRKRARWIRGLRRNAPWQDRVLFLVEMLALVGLVVTLVLFMAEREELNAESLRAMAASISEEADPGSHTTTQELPSILPGRPPPPGDTQPIYPALYADRIVPSTVQNPEPLLDEAEAQRLPARIRIPKINVDAPIVLGDDWESLKKGVGWYLASAKPGERGNIVLSAHNDIYGEIFRYLHKLEAGDEVFIYDRAGREYRYVVAVKRIVEPTAVEVLRQTNEPIATLITCYPYLIDTQRLVVVAELQP